MRRRQAVLTFLSGAPALRLQKIVRLKGVYIRFPYAVQALRFSSPICSTAYQPDFSSEFRTAIIFVFAFSLLVRFY